MAQHTPAIEGTSSGQVGGEALTLVPQALMKSSEFGAQLEDRDVLLFQLLSQLPHALLEFFLHPGRRRAVAVRRVRYTVNVFPSS